MSNEDQHLRERDEVARDALIKRIGQAHRNAGEWFIRAEAARSRGDYTLASNLTEQGMEELRRHGH